MTQPFQFSNGQLAYNAEDLLKLCQQFPDDGSNYLVREDLEKWLAYIGKNDIAQFAANARQTALEDRQKLEEFLNKCHALASPTTNETIEPAAQASVADVKEETTPAPVDKPSSVTEKSEETKVPVAKTEEPSSSPASSDRKPSFFKIVARLIINVLYRNKN